MKGTNYTSKFDTTTDKMYKKINVLLKVDQVLKIKKKFNNIF